MCSGKGLPLPHWSRVGDAKCFGRTVTCFLCCEQWQRLVAPGDAGAAETAESPLVQLPICAERYRGDRSRQPTAAVLTTGTCGREARPPATRSPARPRVWGPGGPQRRCTSGGSVRSAAASDLEFLWGEGDRGCCRRAQIGSGCWGHSCSPRCCETC